MGKKISDNSNSDSSIFQVNLGGVLKILSESLYSKKEVFLRELIQNAVDAIKARNQIEKVKPQILIEFYNQGESKALVFSDNGVGLTIEEVEEFLSKIGASSKSTLLNQTNDFIGQFGIGLLSCFMVSNEIVVVSQSAKADYSIRWTGNINGTYKSEQLDALTQVGTKCILQLRNDIEFDEELLVTLIEDYGKYVGIPIEVEIDGVLKYEYNEQFPWINGVNHEILEFGKQCFKEEFQYYFDLETSDGKNKGIAYILSHPLHQSALQANRVYLKRMFITDKSNNILPDWAFFVNTVINSENLSPTASREDIYENSTLEKVREELGVCIKKYLKNLSQKSPKVLEHIISIHHIALKSLALTDDDFLKFIYKWFKFTTSQGEMNLEEIKLKTKQILYITSIDEFRQVVPIANANNTLVVNAAYIYEADLLESIADFDIKTNYVRINAEYFGNILNDLNLVDYQANEYRLEMLQKHLKPYKCNLEVKRFLPETIPALFYISNQTVYDRDVEEIKKSSDDLWNFISDAVHEIDESLFSKLFLNFNNPVIEKLFKNTNTKNDKLIIETLYINSLMIGHYPLSSVELETMNKNLILMIDNLNNTL